MKIFGPEARGSYGNVTVSRNTYALYQRARAGRGGTPVFPIGDAVLAWQALTFEEQATWYAWTLQIVRHSSLGVPSTLTGAQRFASAWMFATVLGVTPPTVAPSARVPASVEITLVAPGAPGFVSVNVVISGSARLELFVNNPGASTGTTSPPGRGCAWKLAYSNATLFSGPVGTALPMLIPGARCWVRARVIQQDWIASPWAMAGPVVVP